MEEEKSIFDNLGQINEHEEIDLQSVFFNINQQNNPQKSKFLSGILQQKDQINHYMFNPQPLLESFSELKNYVDFNIK